MRPTERFSATVTDYIKYRPGYPKEVLEVLTNECQLTKDKLIADVGSGTGLLAKLLLDNGNIVYGVEPNQEMRTAGENYLSSYVTFHSVNGRAEATRLKDQSVDIITVGTAFHWFDANKTKKEFIRILKSPGWVVLIWNVRDIENSPFLREYEDLLLNYGTDYKESKASVFDQSVVQDFFAPYPMEIKSFPNVQYFDWTGLQGRLHSASYCPRPEDKNYPAMTARLKEIFTKYQQAGQVEFLYQTKLYYGRLK